jgi:hypothetical protein
MRHRQQDEGQHDTAWTSGRAAAVAAAGSAQDLAELGACHVGGNAAMDMDQQGAERTPETVGLQQGDLMTGFPGLQNIFSWFCRPPRI